MRSRAGPLSTALRVLTLLATIGIVLGAGGCATMGSIRGTLTVPPAALDRDSLRLALGEPSARRASIRDAVAYVADQSPGRPRPAGPRERRHVRETQAGFEPYVIVVPAGTTVVFENR